MPLISITGTEVDVLRGPRGLAGADGADGAVVLPAIPSQGEAEAGTDNAKMMTPLRSAQAIAALQRVIASQAEAEGGTENTKAMTPQRVAQAIAAISLWTKINTTSTHYGDSTHGIDFDSQQIAGPIIRLAWTPRATGVVAWDLTPKGAATPIGNRLAWWEACNIDFLASGGAPFHSMRMAVLDDGGAIGTFDFNGQTVARPVQFYVNSNIKGTLNEYGNLYTLGGARGGTYTIADDAVQVIAVPTASDPKHAILAIQRNAPGMAGFLRIKAGTGPTAPVEIVMIAGSITVNYTTGVLTGTTGTNGNITISTHTDGNLYIENRSGAPILIGTYFMILSP